jgi:hypothetical protein
VSDQLDTTYTPFLKGKPSELRALASLNVDQRERLRPLLDGPPEQVKFYKEGEQKWIQIQTVEEALAGYAAKILAAWGSIDHCLVDLAGFDPSLRLPGGIHPVAAFLAEARAVDLAAVPVTGLERDADQVAAVKAACEAWPPLGAAIRLRGPALADPAALPGALMELVARLGLEPGQIDLLIDLGAIIASDAEELAAAAPRLIAALPEIERWRSLVLCSGAFPFEIGSLVKKNETKELPRRDWRLWSELAATDSLPRLPAFGDYGATRADWPSAFDATEMSISGKIVYATDTDWVVVKGEDTKADPLQYHDLAERLRRHPAFLGASHCSGEAAVIRCASHRSGPGNPGTWLTVATRHHVEVVTRQLASLA